MLELKNLGVRRLVGGDDLQFCKDDKPGPGTSDVAAVEVLRGLALVEMLTLQLVEVTTGVVVANY